MINILKPISIALMLGMPAQAMAQSSGAPTDEATQTEDTEKALFTQAELEILVAPVALYPDTLLIQILVAATYPLQIMKSDRLLAANAETDPETLKTAIEAEEWDPSVEVLATAFPDVIADMADHIEWTESVGDAMLAQSDDVMIAVQTMRTQAINTGALIGGEEQTVEVTKDETVIIQPTNPEVVYVPQYDSQVVYHDDYGAGDAIATGLIIFGTFALIDAIFDDDDDWNNYWGCRNCGGWGGGPIIRSPNIDIDVDGNVNIGNGNRRPDGGWKPDDDRKKNASQKITNRRDASGNTRLPIDKSKSRGDDLRGQLSNKSGAADISRPGAKNLPQVERPSKRPDAAKKAAVAKTATRPAATRPAAKRPSVKKPSTHRAAPKRPTASRPATRKKPAATRKHSSGGKARAASSRGKASGGKGRGRR